jgi:hypothetical protein
MPRGFTKPPSPAQPEDSLVLDARAGLTPADMVDGRLAYFLTRTTLAATSPPLQRQQGGAGMTRAARGVK